MGSPRKRPTALSFFPPSPTETPTTIKKPSRTSRLPRKGMVSVGDRVSDSVSEGTAHGTQEASKDKEIEELQPILAGRKRKIEWVDAEDDYRHIEDILEEVEALRAMRENSFEEATNLRTRETATSSPQSSLDTTLTPSLASASTSATTPPLANGSPSFLPKLPPSRTSLLSDKLSSFAPPVPLSAPLRPVAFALYEPLHVLQKTLSPAEHLEYLDPSRLLAPDLTFSFHRLQLEFFCSIALPFLWSTRSDVKTLQKTTSLSPLVELVRKFIPNFDLIRKKFPLKSEGKWRLVSHHEKTMDWIVLKDVLGWIYGKKKIEKEEVYSFLERAPLALLVLVRVHCETSRYALSVDLARQELYAFLLKSKSKGRPSSSPILNSYQRRGKQLLVWLNDSGKKGSARWNSWWTEEVERERDKKRSLTKRWMEADGGWTGIDSLNRWEEQKDS